jgi:hypothetical protein
VPGSKARRPRPFKRRSRDRNRGRQQPFNGVLAAYQSARDLGSLRWFDCQSACPRSVPEPRCRTIPSPSEGNATAKQGCERRPPIAYNLPPDACTLMNACANSPSRRQRTSSKPRCLIVAQHCVSCRWSTPQRRTERKSQVPAHLINCLGSLRGSLLCSHQSSDNGRGAASSSAAIIRRRSSRALRAAGACRSC